ERLGQHAFLALSGATLLAQMAIMASAPPWVFVVALAALGSFGLGLVDTGLNSYIAELPNNSARLNYLHAFYGMGALVGPLLAAGILAQGLSWNQVYLVLAAGALLLAAGLVAVFRMV